MKTALMIITRPFYPSDSGRKAVLRSQFEMIKGMGYEISILILSGSDKIFYNELEGSESDQVKVLTPSNRHGFLARLLSFMKKFLCGYSLNEVFFWDPDVSDFLKKQRAFDLAYFDMVRSMQYSDCVEAKMMVFDFDDLLSKRYSEKGYSDNLLGYKSGSYSRVLKFTLKLVSPLILFYEAYAIRRRERRYLLTKGIKLFVSEKEVEQVRFLPNVSDIYSMPMSFPKRSARWDPKNCRGFLFLGNLDYAPNIESLQYIVESLLPLVSKKTQIFVIGKKNPNVESKFSNDNVIFLGFVDDIQDAFVTSLALLAPIFSGGGIKTKVIEAFSYGLPVIGSPKAFEGLNVARDIGFVANCSEDFVSYMSSAITDPVSLLGVSRNCESYFMENFETGVVFDKFKSIIYSQSNV